MLSYHSSDPEPEAISMAKAAEWAFFEETAKHLLETDWLNYNYVLLEDNVLLIRREDLKVECRDCSATAVILLQPAPQRHSEINPDMYSSFLHIYSVHEPRSSDGQPSPLNWLQQQCRTRNPAARVVEAIPKAARDRPRARSLPGAATPLHQWTAAQHLPVTPDAASSLPLVTQAVPASAFRLRSPHRPHQQPLDGPFPLQSGQDSSRAHALDTFLLLPDSGLGPAAYNQGSSKDALGHRAAAVKVGYSASSVSCLTGSSFT